MLSSVLPALRQSARRVHTAAPAAPLEVTLALVKPAVAAHSEDVNAILRGLKRMEDMHTVQSQWIRWSAGDAAQFYAEHEGRFFFPRLVAGMSAGPALALALSGPDVIRRWRALLGPTKAFRAKYEAPASLRARYGLTDTRNAFHGSDSIPSALRELGFVFPHWNAQAWLDEHRKPPTQQ